jgi:hypothetical protein
MPFVNHEQEAACHAQAERDVAAGYRPRWNCDEYKNEVEGSYNNQWIPLSEKELQIYTGVRGGRYRIVNGEKFYGNSFKRPNSAKVSAKKSRSVKKASKKNKMVLRSHAAK